MNKKPLRDKTYTQQGFNACKQGAALYECPYDLYTRAADFWMMGWFDFAKLVLDQKYPPITDNLSTR
jgi:hypothetical protein